MHHTVQVNSFGSAPEVKKHELRSFELHNTACKVSRSGGHLLLNSQDVLLAPLIKL